MCDFSEYGGPSEEWLAVQATLPALAFDITQNPLTLQQVVNAGREETSAQGFASLSSQVDTKTYTVPTRDGSSIQARSYRPKSVPSDEKLPVFLYFHGGGFIFGNLETEDAACALYAISTGVIVLHANYRHTPHHAFPTAWDDAQDAFAWLHKNIEPVGGDPAKVVVGGVSAGGQLSASLALEKHLGVSEVLKGLPDLAGQILMIPALATGKDTYSEIVLSKLTSPSVSSSAENADAPLLPAKVIDFFTSLLAIPPTISPTNTKLNIAGASIADVTGMPPTVFGIAGLDPLRDEALLYAKMLTEAKVPTEVRLFKGVPHGFRRFGDKLKASAAWDQCVTEGLSWCLKKPTASGKFEIKVV